MAADTIVTGSKLSTIANAIRAKTGGSSQLTLDQMATAIASIPSGGGADRLTGSIAAAQSVLVQSDYDYDVSPSDFPSVGIRDTAFYCDYHVRDVTFPSDDAFIDEVRSSTFSQSRIRRLVLPTRTDNKTWKLSPGSISNGDSGLLCNWFSGCARLEYVDLSPVATFTRYNSEAGMFKGCTKLATVLLPAAATFDLYQMDFYRCTSLEGIVLPDGATMSGATHAYRTFEGCTSLKAADFGTGVTYLNGAGGGQSTLGGCAAMERLILRSTSMVTLSGSGCLFSLSSSLAIPASLDGIYVPDDLVATYKADANWSKYESCIKPIGDLPSQS